MPEHQALRTELPRATYRPPDAFRNQHAPQGVLEKILSKIEKMNPQRVLHGASMLSSAGCLITAAVCFYHYQQATTPHKQWETYQLTLRYFVKGFLLSTIPWWCYIDDD